MLTLTSSIDTCAYLFTYMFLYNLSLTIFFWTLFNTVVSEFKNLYSFSNLSFNAFYLLILTILILSMAGVPPFIGFFSKLFIIVLLINNSFFLLYALFFVVLFLGLYFYVQNLRFLHSTNHQSLNYAYSLNERSVPIFFYAVNTIIIFLVLGVIYVDDVILFFSWILL